MNTMKKLLPLMLAILFAFTLLASACSQPETPVDYGTDNSSGKSGGETKDNGVNTESDTLSRRLWPTLGKRQVLTVSFNEGKAQSFTAAQLDELAHTTAAVIDRNSGRDKNGSKVSYQGVSLKTVLEEIGLSADGAKKLILVDASGRETDLTAEIANISLPSCTFALCVDGELLPDAEIGCFVIIYKDGTRNAEHRGIVEIKLEF